MIRLRSIFILLFLIISLQSISQESKKFSFEVYGILDMQGLYNDRNTYSAIDGLFSLYPLSPSYG
ncbi:MAG: hypothetical protein WCR29_04135, partial [Bacteroidales bacterium]